MERTEQGIKDVRTQSSVVAKMHYESQKDCTMRLEQKQYLGGKMISKNILDGMKELSPQIPKPQQIPKVIIGL